MPMLTSQTTLTGVTRVKRPGSIGFIYRAQVSIEELFELIRYNRVSYSPLTQRGFAERRDRTDAEFDQLLSLNDDDLQIDNNRAEQMAVKFLMGHLYSANIVWNARREGDIQPEFDSDAGTLSIKTTITVPPRLLSTGIVEEGSRARTLEGDHLRGPRRHAGGDPEISRRL
jgi:hypothetical protein